MYEIPQEYLQDRNQYETVSQKDNGFMRWFLEVDKQIEELVFHWRAYERDFSTGEYKKTPDSDKYRMMNEQGVKWCYQFLKSFLGKANMSSSYNEDFINFVMREYVSLPIFQGLEAHYHDFGFKRGVDLETVGVQMCNLCLAVLLGARANGYRTFLTQTHQVSEVKSTGMEERKGFFSALGGLLGKRQQTPQEMYYTQQR